MRQPSNQPTAQGRLARIELAPYAVFSVDVWLWARLPAENDLRTRPD